MSVLHILTCTYTNPNTWRDTGDAHVHDATRRARHKTFQTAQATRHDPRRYNTTRERARSKPILGARLKVSSENGLVRQLARTAAASMKALIWPAACARGAQRCECAACTILRPTPSPSSMRKGMEFDCRSWNSSKQTRNPADSRARQPSRKCGARAKAGLSGAGRWRTYGISDLDHSAELRDLESGATSPARANKQRDAILSCGRSLGWVKKSGT